MTTLLDNFPNAKSSGSRPTRGQRVWVTQMRIWTTQTRCPRVGRLLDDFAFRTSAELKTAHFSCSNSYLSYSNALFASRPTSQRLCISHVGRFGNSAFQLLKCAFHASADSPTARLSNSNALLVSRPTSQRLCISHVGRLGNSAFELLKGAFGAFGVTPDSPTTLHLGSWPTRGMHCIYILFLSLNHNLKLDTD